MKIRKAIQKDIEKYNKSGFYVVGIKREYYPNGDDKLRMEKTLR